jgi:SAM-dependent methyltransferase
MSQILPFDADTSKRLEAMYRGPDAVRRRSAALRALALRPGERVLDIGCGPGFLASEIADAVGATGSVRAIDASEAMLAIARARCAAQPWVTIERGDAAQLAFPDASFDVGVSVQVHEYVKDVAGSLAQLVRVLRPGGRALVVATDWGSIVWRSSQPDRMARVLSAWSEHLAHPHLPQALWGLLTRAGFRFDRCEALVQLNPALEPNTYSHGILELIRLFVAGRRGVTQAEADAWAEDLRELGRQGEYFFSLNQYFFLAAKP